jgi:hypothetical protein
MNKMSLTSSTRQYRKLNRTAKQAFFTARRRNGDVTRIAKMSDYSVSHVSNIMSGRRIVNQEVANAMYMVSRRRMKNTERQLSNVA